MKKLYCYVDETGQDTGGQLFIVALILQEPAKKDILEAKLIKIEQETSKRLRKWSKTTTIAKQNYLMRIFELKELSTNFYVYFYHNVKEYMLVIAQAIIKVVGTDYEVIVIIDGLNMVERAFIQRELKKSGIKYRKVRGMRDEQSAWLRLADAVAGFSREVYENEPYTKSIKKPGCLDLVTQHCKEVG